eukprot:1161160-Pelagomonas_calceolata.AAC.6
MAINSLSVSVQAHTVAFSLRACWEHNLNPLSQAGVFYAPHLAALCFESLDDLLEEHYGQALHGAAALMLFPQALHRAAALTSFPLPHSTRCWKGALAWPSIAWSCCTDFVSSSTARSLCTHSASPAAQYALLEERYGLAKHCMEVYERASKSVPKAERMSIYDIYIAKASEFFGIGKVSEDGSEGADCKCARPFACQRQQDGQQAGDRCCSSDLSQLERASLVLFCKTLLLDGRVLEKHAMPGDHSHDWPTLS